ncbi:ABC transporter ATP-binding protein [Bythopirellula goksoeyrii]|uniref:Trehalose import ATP-binding protein SugC n=1 Tax=Bythopirellula goksoeyrii TaxID=1400387 RepID=A0A5B9Q609_9BACT|nr:sn-glycerol-3-phosphate ABC transporter ATP-binding protein UgpC [Bythopirellula goksoeyrii]QEG32832.1 Trehalose import ATP-binding protein SugC [Bythopirellula goksoeyrii]
MASVTLENVSKIFPGDVYGVRDFDLQIRDGEFLVLVGPSGCGKSTTLRMIAGLETISAGTLKIGDRVVNDVHPRSRDIAMVFQNYALYPHMTVFDNMAFALKMRKTPKAEIKERVAWAAGLLGLEPLMARKPKALSGGQRQRVALGRAIVRKPAVFLFDEPLSNLDAKLRIETRAEIKRLHRELGTTTIYVTHDQEEAMTLGDRVCVMCDGLQRQCAPPLEIYRNPADRFVAGFLGMPSMNFFEGHLERTDGQIWFDNVDVRLRTEGALSEWLGSENRRDIVAGIRPESFQFNGSEAASEGKSISATVQIVEPLGSQMDVYLVLKSGARIVCRVPAQSLAEGKSVALRVDPEEIHLFEPRTAEEPYGRSLRVEEELV